MDFEAGLNAVSSMSKVQVGNGNILVFGNTTSTHSLRSHRPGALREGGEEEVIIFPNGKTHTQRADIVQRAYHGATGNVFDHL